MMLHVSSEKAMAPHSSTFAWKIPWMEEPGRLQSMGSQRVRHDLVTKPPPLPVPQTILPTTWATLSRLYFYFRLC